MQSLTTALENLLRHLSQEIPATPGIRVIDIPFPLKDAFDALSWLVPVSRCIRNSTGNNVMVMKKLPSWVRLPVLRRWTRHNVFFASTRNTPTYASGG
ncbi:hypothetical protein ECO2947_08925 [Escherichia coli]|nr:hypothetical protein ECO2947_08925 [Escherichia coli]